MNTVFSITHVAYSSVMLLFSSCKPAKIAWPTIVRVTVRMVNRRLILWIRNESSGDNAMNKRLALLASVRKSIPVFIYWVIGDLVILAFSSANTPRQSIDSAIAINGVNVAVVVNEHTKFFYVFHTKAPNA